MSNKKLSKKDAKQAVEAYRQTGSYTKAAEILGLARGTLISRVQRAKQILSPAEIPADEPVDKLELRRLRDENNQLKAEVKDAERRAVEAEDIRGAVLKLTKEPFAPQKLRAPVVRSDTKQPEIPVLLCSDWHFGEVIDKEEMGGINSFSTKIAEDRYARLIEKTIMEMTDWWVGPKPEVFYYLRGGDMIGGEIHEELAISNDAWAIPSVNNLIKLEAAGLQKIRDETGVEIRVISVPGNHGRVTKKPTAKGFAINNYDLMSHTLLEWHFHHQGADWITFSAPTSGEALFEIYGRNFLLLHGDRMGTGGGTGFMGSIAPISRGHKLTFDNYAQRGTILYKILSCHYHTPVMTVYGMGNGCLGGPSEYSQKLKAVPRPASQWFFSVHSHVGITRYSEIFVGSPKEGSIYESHF